MPALARVPRRTLLAGTIAICASATGLGAIFGGWPRRSRPVPRIGFLAVAGPQDPRPIEAFRASLRDYGWRESETVQIEWRFPADAAEFPELAADLVSLPVDVLVGAGSGGAIAAKSATDAIPVVFLGSTDPVAQGLVLSLAQPGTNATGVSQGLIGLVGKRLELLKELVPGIARVGVLWYPDQPFNQIIQQEFRSTASALGIQLVEAPVRIPDDMDQALDIIAGGDVQALCVGSDSLFRNQQTKILEFALRNRLPTSYQGRGVVVAGGFMGFGPNDIKTYQRGASFVDRILRGARPADLPVEFSTEFDLVVNARTAQALGLTIPPDAAAQVNEWIR